MRCPLFLCCSLALWACKPAESQPAHLTLTDAPAGDVAPLVKAHAARSHGAHRQGVVYVGAPWCEPCRRFHEAAEKGALDGVFGTLDLLVFNADVDAERLALAGYQSRLIPLLALPDADGRASAWRIEGSIKGDGAVAEMTPRLQALLEKAK